MEEKKSMKATTIAGVSLLGFVMMFALAPSMDAFAASPPSAPEAGENPPEVDECEEIANSDLPQDVKDRLLALAGCA